MAVTAPPTSSRMIPVLSAVLQQLHAPFCWSVVGCQGGLGFRVQGLGFRVWGLGLRVESSGWLLCDLGVRMSDQRSQARRCNDGTCENRPTLDLCGHPAVPLTCD